MHGNNKSDEELKAAARAGAGLVVVDALDEVERAAEAGVRRDPRAGDSRRRR